MSRNSKNPLKFIDPDRDPNRHQNRMILLLVRHRIPEKSQEFVVNFLSFEL